MHRTRRSRVPWSRASRCVARSLLVDILPEYWMLLVECQLEGFSSSRRHWRLGVRRVSPAPGGFRDEILPGNVHPAIVFVIEQEDRGVGLLGACEVKHRAIERVDGRTIVAAVRAHFFQLALLDDPLTSTDDALRAERAVVYLLELAHRRIERDVVGTGQAEAHPHDPLV